MNLSTSSNQIVCSKDSLIDSIKSPGGIMVDSDYHSAVVIAKGPDANSAELGMRAIFKKVNYSLVPHNGIDYIVLSESSVKLFVDNKPEVAKDKSL